jgi:hypothetical protein
MTTNGNACRTALSLLSSAAGPRTTRCRRRNGALPMCADAGPSAFHGVVATAAQGIHSMALLQVRRSTGRRNGPRFRAGDSKHQRPYETVQRRESSAPAGARLEPRAIATAAFPASATSVSTPYTRLARTRFTRNAYDAYIAGTRDSVRRRPTVTSRVGEANGAKRCSAPHAQNRHFLAQQGSRATVHRTRADADLGVLAGALNSVTPYAAPLGASDYAIVRSRWPLTAVRTPDARRI